MHIKSQTCTLLLLNDRGSTFIISLQLFFSCRFHSLLSNKMSPDIEDIYAYIHEDLGSDKTWYIVIVTAYFSEYITDGETYVSAAVSFASVKV